MTWNKDGLTNNAPISLFIICPINYDNRVVDNDVSPRGHMRVSVYYPASAPNGAQINCIIRQGRSIDTGPNSSDEQIFDLNMAFLVGVQDFSGTGDNDTASSVTFDMNSSEDATMHMLCLMPAGSTLRMYQLDHFE